MDMADDDIRRAAGRAAPSYHRFYWPLALCSLITIIEAQFQNGILARYPGGPAELATFALASSSFHLLAAFLVFVPQMVTVLGRSAQSRQACLVFVAAVGLLLTLPLAVAAFSPVGPRLLVAVLNVPPTLLPGVTGYLRWLTPLVLANALRHYFTGLLIQAERTQAVTVLNLLHLGVLAGGLLCGFHAGWGPVPTLAGATLAANLLHLALGFRMAGRTAHPEPAGQDGQALTHRQIFAFFWPVALTSGMFAMSRPVMYAFINLTAAAVTTVAALRLAFDVAMTFQNPANQFRHLYATYGHEDPRGVRRFMLRVSFGLTAAMMALAFSPLGRWFFGAVLNAEGEVLAQAVGVLRILCLVPIIITVRNLFHGHMMVRRRTLGMAVAAVLRVAAIALCSWLLHRLGLLSHLACGALLVLGFTAEALVSGLSVAAARLSAVPEPDGVGDEDSPPQP